MTMIVGSKRQERSYAGAYMQKTCDVAEMAILAKKICGKSAYITTKCKSRQKCVNRENR